MATTTKAAKVESAIKQLAEALGTNPEGVKVEVQAELGTTIIDGADLFGDSDEPEDTTEGSEDNIKDVEETPEGGHLKGDGTKCQISEAIEDCHVHSEDDNEVVEDDTEGVEVTKGEAREAVKGLGESLKALMERTDASFRGKVGSGISEADDRAKLYKYRFGTCSEDGCNQGCYQSSDDYCRQHQSKTDSKKSESPKGAKKETDTEGDLSKAEFVQKLMAEGTSAVEAAKTATEVYN